MMSSTSKSAASQSPSEHLPLTATQAYLLPTLADPLCEQPYKQYWTFTEGLRIKPGVNPRRLERALKRLVRRHDVLRLAFTTKDGKWCAVQRNEDEIQLKVEDFGDITEQEMQRACTSIVDQTMEVTADSLCDFRLLRFGALGDVIFIRLHHAITDGFGITVMVEDLIKFFLGMPMLGKPLSHLDYIKDVDAALPQHVGKIDKYWRELLFPPPDPIPFGRVQKGMSLSLEPSHVKTIVSHSINISSEDFGALSDRLTESGATFFTALVAGLGDVIHDTTKADDIIGRTVRGRSSATLSGYAGMDLRFPFFRTKIEDGKTVIGRAVALNEQIKVSSNFLSRELAKPVNQLEREISEATGIGPQIFVHIASADGRLSASMFSELFRAEGGTVMTVGNVEIERMAFRRPPALSIPSEVALYVIHSNSGVRIELRADGSVFDKAELSEIAQHLDEKLINI